MFLMSTSTINNNNPTYILVHKILKTFVILKNVYKFLCFMLFILFNYPNKIKLCDMTFEIIHPQEKLVYIVGIYLVINMYLLLNVHLS